MRVSLRSLIIPAFTVSFILVIWLAEPPDYEIFVLFLLLLVAMFAPVLWKLSKGTFDVLEPITFVFMPFFVFYVLRGIHLEYFSFRAPSSEEIFDALLLVLVGWLAFLAGYFFPVSRRRFSGTRAGNEILMPARTLLLGAALAGVTVFCTGYGLAQWGGLRFVLLNYRYRGFFHIGLGYLVFGMVIAVPTMLIFFYAWLKKKLGWPFLLAQLVVWGFSILAISARAELLELALGMAIVWHYCRRRISYKLFAAIVGVLLLTVTVSGYVRTFTGARELTVVDVAEFSLLADVSMLDSLIEIRKAVPDSLPYLKGESYLGLLYFPIPRRFYPGKSETFGSDLYAATFLPEQRKYMLSVGYGIVGELFWNFGHAGVVAGMMFFGILCQWLYKNLRANPDKYSLFYAVLMPLCFRWVKAGYFDFVVYAVEFGSVIVLFRALCVRRARIQHSLARSYSGMLRAAERDMR